MHAEDKIDIIDDKYDIDKYGIKDPYTVVLAVPDADGPTPWHNMYVWLGEATGTRQAIDNARAAAVTDHSYQDNPEDYAVVYMCFGEHQDITPSDEC